MLKAQPLKVEIFIFIPSTCANSKRVKLSYTKAVI